MKWIFHGIFASSAYLNCNHDGKCHVEAKPGKDVNQKSFDFLNQKAEEPLFYWDGIVFSLLIFSATGPITKISDDVVTSQIICADYLFD